MHKLVSVLLTLAVVFGLSLIPAVSVSAGEASGSVSLNATTPIITAITVSPDTLDFGEVMPGDVVPAEDIIVENTGTLEISVDASIDPTGTVFDYLKLDDVGTGPWSYIIESMFRADSESFTTLLNVPYTYVPQGPEVATLTFVATPKVVSYRLTTSVSPEGSGSIEPDGGKYEEGTEVTLTATPNPGYEFASWSGDASGSENPTTITMDSDKSVTANFSLEELTADFTYAPAYPGIGEEITFTDETTGGATPYTREWDFGDATTSTAKNPVHSYPAAEDYTITLTVTDDEGTVSIATDTVTVTNKPVVIEMISPEPGAIIEYGDVVLIQAKITDDVEVYVAGASIDGKSPPNVAYPMSRVGETDIFEAWWDTTDPHYYDLSLGTHTIYVVGCDFYLDIPRFWYCETEVEVVEPVVPPVWEVSNSWSYNYTYDSGPMEIPPVAARVTNEGGMDISVTDTSGDNYTLSADYVPDADRVDATTGSALTVLEADVTINKANMQYVKQFASLLAYGAIADNATITWTYTPVPSWTLDVGATYNFTKHTVDELGIVDKTDTRQGEILGVENVTVPAGTFSCVHIVEYDPATPETYTYEHWFNETVVKSDVKMIDRETYKGEEIRELTSYPGM